jgi:predicted Zn-ribbon and HTH transcriptional regulator
MSVMPTVKLPTLKCKRCNHEWFPRNPRLPGVCPECKNPNWNKPKKRVSKPTKVELTASAARA